MYKKGDMQDISHVMQLSDYVLESQRIKPI